MNMILEGTPYIPLTEEQEKKLREPLPPEAITQHPTKNYLSNIKGIYVTERFNDVFGIGGWRMQLDEKPSVGKMAIVKVIFTVPANGIYLECFGGNDNVDTGDALKGSTTDALSKIGSYLQVGADVYKGIQKATTGSKSSVAETTQVPTMKWINDAQVEALIGRINAEKDIEKKQGLLKSAQENFRISTPNLNKIQEVIK